jgi:hypothetical protein
MPKLVSMKLDAKAREEKYAETVAVDRPAYPWGLSLTLDEDALEKLDVGELPEVGKTMLVLARVDVTSVSSHESEHGKNRSVSLQITEMCLEADPGKGGAADKLYGG